MVFLWNIRLSGDTYEFGTGSFTVMAPSGISKNSNDNSVVIRLVNGNNGFLFMGDAEETSEQDMISTGKSLDCDVLCLGHHGSASSTSWESSGSLHSVLGSGKLWKGKFLRTSDRTDNGKAF